MNEKSDEFTLQLNGNEFSCSICRDNSGSPNRGNILRRYGRLPAAMFDHPGPWETDKEALESMLARVKSIAFSAPSTFTGCSE
ncbi:hypothetical protein [Pseudomonas pergaminensis]